MKPTRAKALVSWAECPSGQNLIRPEGRGFLAAGYKAR